jgi:hypothetical protein
MALGLGVAYLGKVWGEKPYGVILRIREGTGHVSPASYINTTLSQTLLVFNFDSFIPMIGGHRN